MPDNLNFSKNFPDQEAPLPGAPRRLRVIVIRSTAAAFASSHQEPFPCRPAGSFSASSSPSLYSRLSPITGLVALRQRVNQAFADIDVQLKQRHDLIPNLVETVKGYAAHERGTLDDGHQGAQRRDVGAGAGAGRRRREPVERRARPAVRAVGGLSGPQGQRQLPATCRASCPTSRTRSPPAAASSTTRFRNTTPASSSFPAALFAGAFGFTRKEFFDLGASRTEVEQTPQVKF